MARNLLRLGAVKAGQWAQRAAREGFTVPVPQSILDRLAARVDDTSIRDLSLTPQPGNRLRLSGLKKKGVWVEFAAEFRIAHPDTDDPPQSLVLALEKAEPFFARKPLLDALEAIQGVHVRGERILVDLGGVIAASDWGGRIPAAVRNRLRIREVATTEDGRLRLRVALA